MSATQPTPTMSLAGRRDGGSGGVTIRTDSREMTGLGARADGRGGIGSRGGGGGGGESITARSEAASTSAGGAS